MKLASGFCIPEPLPVHTGIKGRQVHPLIRFLLQSRVDEKCADLQKPFISYLYLVGITVQSAESGAVTGWCSGRSEGISKSLSAGYVPTDLLLLTELTFHPVPG